jgi:glucose-6-phosphate isomerase
MAKLSKQKLNSGSLETVYKSQLDRAHKTGLITEIINKNPAVFRKRDKGHQKIILNRLGWVDVVEEMQAEMRRIDELVQYVRQMGTRHLLVLGMGGSSLGPEVFGKLFGAKSWLKSYTIIDTTAPSQLESIMKTIDLEKSFFIISSKSGATIETISQFRFFFKKMKQLRPLKVGNYFAAITDRGTDLHRMARRNRFQETFINHEDIGGRYSALSFFGLVPAAFTRADLPEIIKHANDFLNIMKDEGSTNDALTLGTLMGCCAKSGCDKLKFITTESIAPFIVWIEQLVAESTGKELKGIIPIEGGANGAGYNPEDCLYINYSMRGDRARSLPMQKGSVGRLPSIAIEMFDLSTIGAEMLKWEMATTIAATIMGVNPFDEPNVAESKRNMAAILHHKRGPRKIIPIDPYTSYDGLDVISISGIKGLERKRNVGAEEMMQKFLAGIRKGDYLSILCYSEMDDEIEERLTRLRRLIETKYAITTLRGYGPRFLHSTGQLFKGGSQKGHFLIIEREYKTDYEIPGQNISFGRLIKAQAQGDIKALRKRKRPVININLKEDPSAGLDRLCELVDNT